jgi:hypothetical protein
MDARVFNQCRHLDVPSSGAQAEYTRKEPVSLVAMMKHAG